jgi:hypothetical protein
MIDKGKTNMTRGIPAAEVGVRGDAYLNISWK